MSIPAQEVAATSQKPHTYQDYCSLPEGSPYQLIGGELVLTPAPGTYHQVVSMKLELQMASFVLNHDLGLVLYAPVDVYLGETETYQPDVVFISRERMPIIEPARINGAPDLVVEILSPATAYYDLRKKYKTYEKCGVKEYWVVDPEEKSVQLFTLVGGKFTLDQEAEGEGEIASRVIQGLRISLPSIF